MRESKFKIGDLVKIKDTSGLIDTIGCTGKVIAYSEGGWTMGVQLDDSPVYGHNCGGIGEDGKCFWYHESDLDLISDTEPIPEQEAPQTKPSPIKRILFVEDGSVDYDTLVSVLEDRNPDIYVVTYRQGSRAPFLVDLDKEKTDA